MKIIEWIPASKPPTANAIEVITHREGYTIAEGMWLGGLVAEAQGIKPGFYYVGGGVVIPLQPEWWLPRPQKPANADLSNDRRK